MDYIIRRLFELGYDFTLISGMKKCCCDKELSQMSIFCFDLKSSSHYEISIPSGWNYASESALICPEKAKQELEPLDGLSLSQDSDWRRIDKGLVYSNAYNNDLIESGFNVDDEN